MGSKRFVLGGYVQLELLIMHMLLLGESWLLSHSLMEESVENLDKRMIACYDAFAREHLLLRQLL